MTWQVGSWMFDPPSQPSEHNAAFIALDVEVVAPRREFDERIQSLINELHAAPPAEGSTGVQLPGEREWINYRRAQTEGIDLPADVLGKLRECADFTGISPNWLKN